jgi:hypothetical protein
MIADYVNDDGLKNAVQVHFENQFISERVLDMVSKDNFVDVAFEHSNAIKNSFQGEYIDQNNFEKNALNSLNIFRGLDENDETGIQEFVKLYNDKIKEM